MTRALGKGEVESSILSCSTINTQENKAKPRRAKKTLCADSRMNDSGTAAENWQGRQARVEGDVAYVPLTKGYEAVIDACDAPWVSRNSWKANVQYRADGSVRAIYASRTERLNGRFRSVMLHREVMKAPSGVETDHINGDALDNRRCNLRLVTTAQNQFNSRTVVTSTSGVKGVSWHKADAKWHARIRHNGVRHYLGAFDSLETARIAYAGASAELHGEFGRLE